jgi:hypothetical protein
VVDCYGARATKRLWSQISTSRPPANCIAFSKGSLSWARQSTALTINEHCAARGPAVLLDAIELAQIIAITDLCDNLTCFRAFLVNKVQTNEVGWLMVFGFGHELRHSMCWSCVSGQKPMPSADVIRIARPHQDTYRPRALLASGIRKERQRIIDKADRQHRKERKRTSRGPFEHRSLRGRRQLPSASFFARNK